MLHLKASTGTRRLDHHNCANKIGPAYSAVHRLNVVSIGFRYMTCISLLASHGMQYSS